MTIQCLIVFFKSVLDRLDLVVRNHLGLCNSKKDDVDVGIVYKSNDYIIVNKPEDVFVNNHNKEVSVVLSFNDIPYLHDSTRSPNLWNKRISHVLWLGSWISSVHSLRLRCGSLEFRVIRFSFFSSRLINWKIEKKNAEAILPVTVTSGIQRLPSDFCFPNLFD